MINLKQKINQTIETLSENQLKEVFDFVLGLKKNENLNQDKENRIDFNIVKDVDGILVVKSTEKKQVLTTEDVNKILENLREKSHA